jgi:hypothetical protein
VEESSQHVDLMTPSKTERQLQIYCRNVAISSLATGNSFTLQSPEIPLDTLGDPQETKSLCW